MRTVRFATGPRVMPIPVEPQKPKRLWLKITLGIIVLAAIAAVYSQIDVHRVHAFLQRWPGWAVFVAITALPLCGFPVTVLHVVAGMRWGPRLGILLVSISILLQLLASYGLVYLFRGRFERRFDYLRQRLPKGAHSAVTLFTLLLPGVPYFAKNYVLPIAGVPLRIYLLWAFPIHALRSAVAVVFGHESDQLTPWRIAGFVVYFAAVTLSCAWAFRRLRAEVANRPPAASDPKPSA